MDNHSNYDETKHWTDINLKTFFTVLALTNPDIKQSQIAKELGIAPATLSRIINGTYGDGKMRMEWIPILKPYLMSAEMHRLMGELQSIETLQNYYDTELRHDLVMQLISEYPDDNEWILSNNWTRPNSFLYCGNNSTSWYLFDVLNVHTNIKDILSYYMGYIKCDLETRISFLCYDEATFSNCVEYLIFSLGDSRLAKCGVKFSAMWVNLDQRKLSSEYFLRLEW